MHTKERPVVLAKRGTEAVLSQESSDHFVSLFRQAAKRRRHP